MLPEGIRIRGALSLTFYMSRAVVDDASPIIVPSWCLRLLEVAVITRDVLTIPTDMLH